MWFYDLRLLENEALLPSNAYVSIYGAGEKGKEIKWRLYNAGIEVNECIDQDQNKWGSVVDGMVCVSPETYISQIRKNAEKNSFLIVCIENPYEVWAEYREVLSGDEVKFITYFGINQFLYQNRENIYANNEEILWEYEKEKNLKKIEISEGYPFLLRTFLLSENDIWVLQPGKVGSTTINSMLKKRGIKTYHGHHVVFRDFLLNGFEGDYRFIWKKSIYERTRKGLKIICLVRNPFDRDYSAFWQGFTKETMRNRMIFDRSENLQSMYDSFIEDVILKNQVLKKYGLVRPGIWCEEFRWFDEELKDGLGIDVYKYSFNPKKGFEVIRDGNIELFLCKVEMLDKILSELSSFVGEPLEISKENTAESKWYYMAFKAFRKEVKISREYVNHYLESDKTKHFYSEGEMCEFLSSWEANIV